MGRINVQLMWNGVWKVIDKHYEYEPRDNFQAKSLVLKHDETPTLDRLKEKVARRMGLDMDKAPYIDLFHMRPGLEKWPATMIDEDEVPFLFDTYESRDTVRMFVKYDSSGSSGNQLLVKKVPRRNNSMVLATIDSPSGSLPNWDC